MCRVFQPGITFRSLCFQSRHICPRRSRTNPKPHALNPKSQNPKPPLNPKPHILNSGFGCPTCTARLGGPRVANRRPGYQTVGLHKTPISCSWVLFLSCCRGSRKHFKITFVILQGQCSMQIWGATAGILLKSACTTIHDSPSSPCVQLEGKAQTRAFVKFNRSQSHSQRSWYKCWFVPQNLSAQP